MIEEYFDGLWDQYCKVISLIKDQQYLDDLQPLLNQLLDHYACESLFIELEHYYNYIPSSVYPLVFKQGYQHYSDNPHCLQKLYRSINML